MCGELVRHKKKKKQMLAMLVLNKWNELTELVAGGCDGGLEKYCMLLNISSFQIHIYQRMLMGTQLLVSLTSINFIAPLYYIKGEKKNEDLVIS